MPGTWSPPRRCAWPLHLIAPLPCAPQDPRVERLPCTHKGTYADDCICERVKQHRCYIVATCDRDLRRRIRKIPGVPIMYIQSHKWVLPVLVPPGVSSLLLGCFRS